MCLIESDQNYKLTYCCLLKQNYITNAKQVIMLNLIPKIQQYFYENTVCKIVLKIQNKFVNQSQIKQ